MSRTVVAFLVALLALALALPAGAAAESLSVTPGSDPVAGMANHIDYEYDSGSAPMNLTIIARPQSGPPCGATAPIDAAQVGASGGSTNVTPTPIELAAGHGLGSVPFTFTTAGAYRICGWLARSPDDVAAVGVNDANVRLPNASLAITAQQDQPKAGGSGLTVRVTGSLEAADDIYVTAVPGTSGCPPTYDEDTDPLAFDVVPAGTATRVAGAFDLQFDAHDLMSYRAWRVCAYAQDGVTASAAAATATATIDLLLKPQLLRRPRVRRDGGALACDGGRWKARPKAKLTYAWLKGGRPIPGAKGSRLALKPALKGKAVSCRVTARNKVGKATGTSKPIKA